VRLRIRLGSEVEDLSFIKSLVVYNHLIIGIHRTIAHYAKTPIVVVLFRKIRQETMDSSKYREAG
jgi:hypothetical protein